MPLEKRAFCVNLLRAFEASNTILMMTADLTADDTCSSHMTLTL
ncbi:hypothetical protein [Methanomethylovorans hollandica]|nr:hypothetical protein [Methanomethylovorans hollandica]